MATKRLEIDSFRHVDPIMWNHILSMPPVR